MARKLCLPLMKCSKICHFNYSDALTYKLLYISYSENFHAHTLGKIKLPTCSPPEQSFFGERTGEMTFGLSCVELCCRRSGRDCSLAEQISGDCSHSSRQPDHFCLYLFFQHLLPPCLAGGNHDFPQIISVPIRLEGKKKNRRNCSAPVLIHATKFPGN